MTVQTLVARRSIDRQGSAASNPAAARLDYFWAYKRLLPPPVIAPVVSDCFLWFPWLSPALTFKPWSLAQCRPPVYVWHIALYSGTESERRDGLQNYCPPVKLEFVAWNAIMSWTEEFQGAAFGRREGLRTVE